MPNGRQWIFQDCRDQCHSCQVLYQTVPYGHTWCLQSQQLHGENYLVQYISKYKYQAYKAIWICIGYKDRCYIRIDNLDPTLDAYRNMQKRTSNIKSTYKIAIARRYRSIARTHKLNIQVDCSEVQEFQVNVGSSSAWPFQVNCPSITLHAAWHNVFIWRLKLNKSKFRMSNGALFQPVEYCVIMCWLT